MQYLLTEEEYKSLSSKAREEAEKKLEEASERFKSSIKNLLSLNRPARPEDRMYMDPVVRALLDAVSLSLKEFERTFKESHFPSLH